MTDAPAVPAPAVLKRIRAVALLLPEVEERDAGFHVAGEPFVIVAGPELRLRDADGWTTVTPADDSDWTLIEDRIAHAWELAAPRRLLEAGGR